MSASRNTLFTIIGLFLASLLGAIWLYFQEAPLNSEDSAKQERPLDELMLNATTTRYNQQGEKIQSLSIKKLTHLQDDNKTLFEGPKLTVFESGQPRWHIQSDAGYSLHEDTNPNNRFHKINLEDNVTLKHFNEQSSPWVLLTDQLTIDPENKKTYTQSPVTVKGAGLQLFAKGLEGDFNTHKVKFLQNINATYSPKEKNKK